MGRRLEFTGMLLKRVISRRKSNVAGFSRQASPACDLAPWQWLDGVSPLIVDLTGRFRRPGNAPGALPFFRDLAPPPA